MEVFIWALPADGLRHCLVFEKVSGKIFKMSAKIINFPRKPIGLFTTVTMVVVLPVFWALLALVLIVSSVVLWPFVSLASIGEVLDRYFEG